MNLKLYISFRWKELNVFKLSIITGVSWIKCYFFSKVNEDNRLNKLVTCWSSNITCVNRPRFDQYFQFWASQISYSDPLFINSMLNGYFYNLYFYFLSLYKYFLKGKTIFVCLARVKSYSPDQKLFCRLLYDSFLSKIISVWYYSHLFPLPKKKKKHDLW